MTRVDWIAVAIAVLGALSGLRRGLVATALSFGGLIAGALIGARVAPHLLHGGAGLALHAARRARRRARRRRRCSSGSPASPARSRAAGCR